MLRNCVQAVNAAAGRTLTQAEIRNIDDRLSATMRRMARRDPAAWQAMPQQARVVAAAQQAMGDIRAEAQLKVTRANLQILRTAGMETRLTDLMAATHADRAGALVRDMEHTNAYINGIKQDNLRQTLDLLDAATSTEGVGAARRGLMFLFDAENPGMTRDLAIEILDGASGRSGNALAARGATAWLNAIERMRQRFNAAGGDVGHLDYGYLPQPHDSMRVRGNGSSGARDEWAQNTLPLLDRSRYLNEDGTRMADAQVLDFLRHAWETIATDGLNKTQPGQGPAPGTASRANRGSQERQIHYRDGEAYLQYMGQYGAGSMYDAMVGHIGRLSRDIGLVERYGPNPNAQMRLQFDLAGRATGRDVGDLPRTGGIRPQSYWNILSGTTATPASGRVAEIASNLRNVQTAGKLQGAVIASVTDLGTYFVTTGYNKLSYWESLKNIGSQFDADTRHYLDMHGILSESMISDLNRWAGDNIAQNASGKLAASTMKLSLMNAWTDTLRRAYSMTQMNGLARMSRTEWSKLAEYDRWRMTSKGLTEADWEVMRRAQLDDFKGQPFLTPEAIHNTGDPRANEVVAKVLGMITDESEYAVLNPDLTTKAITSGGGLQRGTITGELARSVMQFKAFPIAMISRHWGRMLETPKGLEGAPMFANRYVYGAVLGTTLTALGAVAFQTKQILQGKDPASMDQPKFWMRAAAQGGGLGIVGDLLLTDPTENPGDATANAIKSLAGPSIGSASDLVFKLGIENAYQAAHGKDTHAGAEAFRVARSHVPYVNLWYARAAMDHAIFNSLQENLSPGYLSKMQQRAQRELGSTYWWRPQETTPDRMPDVTQAFGK